MIKVLRLPAVQSIALILLTVKVCSKSSIFRIDIYFIKIGFAAIDSMTGIELLERGVTKDTLALLAIPLTPLEIFLPFFISKYTTGAKPLNLYANSHPFRYRF